MELQEIIVTALRNKKIMNRVFVFLFALIELLLICLMVATILQGESISQVIAIEIILLWMGILFGYLAWAVYFYNINFGLTNQDWAEIRLKKANNESVDEPTSNPNEEETLGLPKGTIRGTIALTMLIGGLSMTIFSFGLNPDYSEHSFFVDHLDFFKTAFLMMIAFYFGNKALETIGYKSQKVIEIGGTPPRSPMTPHENRSASEARELLNSETDDADIEAASSATQYDHPSAQG